MAAVPTAIFTSKFPIIVPCPTHLLPLSSNNRVKFQQIKLNRRRRAISLQIPRASVESVDYAVEPATDTKFRTELTLPTCPNSFVLLGTGYREKVFAIIGVKVYAAAFYIEGSIGNQSDILRENQDAMFSSVFKLPLAKSLYIQLVRDVDGKTFWNALNDVISPRIKSPTADDQMALSTFQSTFQSRNLKEGTCIILTWLEPSKMLVSISPDKLPSSVDAEIKSVNVNFALYDGFFGDQPVSPTLKASVFDGLKRLVS